MIAPALSQQHDLELRFLAASTRDLLLTGVRVVRNGGLSAANRDSVTTSLAVGLGRLYELALGLGDLTRYGRWTAPYPDAADGDRADLMTMHDAVFDFLSLAPHGQTAERLLSRVTTDPVVPRLITALNAYWDCEQVGPAGARSVTRAWTGVEDACEQDPADYELSLLGGPGGEPAEYLAWRRSVRTSRNAFRDGSSQRLSSTVEAIWFALGVCGRDGAFGQPGEVFAAEVLPPVPARLTSAAA
ncbi:hypothetical protein [Actinomyces sp. MRS3W]|uniref:hypothetical protein n=1 Tax=Actinomyces sp. MRS3W TaxID=2800796 RepID=UPI0028FD1570|nr:hypothetical protein [Actinomyces sp. MRS3W]MDU0349070.1 hypothetical protein [Actinomyces sp. MRS3W]